MNSQYNNSASQYHQAPYGQTKLSQSPHAAQSYATLDHRGHSLAYPQSSKYGPPRTTVSVGASSVAPVFF